MKIKDSVILITGGAAGIGEATAILLAQKGAIVYISDVQRERGEKVAKESKGKINFIYCDVTNEKNVIEMFELIIKKHQRVDVVINCAGIAVMELFATKSKMHSTALFEKVWRINTYGTFLVSKHAANIMIKNSDQKAECNGVIIFISSINAFDAPLGNVGYGMSKAALIGMHLPMARDLGRYKIRVNSICPGFTVTDMTDQFKDKFSVEPIKAATPLKVFGQPQDMAITTQFIIECDFINGTSIRVDGGLRAPMF
jgi:NAD(P)-dependent dehydrogenase (short-subunit alcohol dehydrogenase family)